MSEQNKASETQEEQVVNQAEADMKQADEALEQAEESFTEDVHALLAEARAEADKNKDMALRVQADMENLRRRTRIDVEAAHKFALDKFVNELIPVLDSMELGVDAASKEDVSIQSLKEGTDMTFKLFLDVLQKFDVERLDPVGEKFDPQFHEAMTMIPSPDHESNSVIEVFQKGYTLNARLVRAARVIVAQ